MNGYTDEQLVDLFRYHTPTPEQKEKYLALKRAFLETPIPPPESATAKAGWRTIDAHLLGLARVVVENTSTSPAQARAINALRLARNFINLGIARAAESQDADDGTHLALAGGQYILEAYFHACAALFNGGR
jgi:hypothetical protein